MKKPLKKSHTFTRPATTTIIAVIGCVMALFAVFFCFLLYHTMLANSFELSNEEMRDISSTEQVKFCYENNVKPCDDIAIKEFNNRPENVASGNQFHRGYFGY